MVAESKNVLADLPPAGAPTERALRSALAELASSASVEVTPVQIERAGPLSGLLEPGRAVYVPYLPDANYEATVAACRGLVADGLVPVPHLPARAFRSRHELADRLAELTAAGVDAALLIAGDRAVPAGPFADTLAVLESGVLEGSGIRRIGVAGHPEGHPAAHRRELDRALRVKQDWARGTGSEMWIVTQFAFTAKPVVHWLKRLAGLGCDLPVRAGLPGPASFRTLAAYARQCGIGASGRLLTRRPGTARLLAPWTPERLARDLAQHRVEYPQTPLGGLHVFPFGGVVKAVNWLHDAVRDETGADP